MVRHQQHRRHAARRRAAHQRSPCRVRCRRSAAGRASRGDAQHAGAVLGAPPPGHARAGAGTRSARRPTPRSARRRAVQARGQQLGVGPPGTRQGTHGSAANSARPRHRRVEIAMAQHEDIDGAARPARSSGSSTRWPASLARILRARRRRPAGARAVHQHGRALPHVDRHQLEPGPAAADAGGVSKGQQQQREQAHARGQRQHPAARAEQRRPCAHPAPPARTTSAARRQPSPARQQQNSGCSSAPASVHSGGSQQPASASGVTTKVMSGMATRLAKKPTSDTCWKNSSVQGARPSVDQRGAQVVHRRDEMRPPRTAARAPRLAHRAPQTTPSAAPPPRTRARTRLQQRPGSTSVTTSAASPAPAATASAGRGCAANHRGQHPRALRRHRPAREYGA